mmetsp:Transcript_10298/g.19004  ORF Transcript_10298/g.19004 Transcript_10298/m.19004 type:complete len:87 (+) Transcript_10298:63-323(+)
MSELNNGSDDEEEGDSEPIKTTERKETAKKRVGKAIDPKYLGRRVWMVNIDPYRANIAFAMFQDHSSALVLPQSLMIKQFYNGANV